MIGIVNQALRSWLIERAGRACWLAVSESSGVGQANFLTFEEYPDDITLRLAEKTSELLGISCEQVLGEAGKFWITHRGPAVYGELMEFSAETFADYLRNMDRLHTSLVASLPGLRAPFMCNFQFQDAGLTIAYPSELEAFKPFLAGSLKALAQRFGTEIEISEATPLDDGGFAFEIDAGQASLNPNGSPTFPLAE
ncbi:MAG: heme NO-binding domain-containing protein [Myxococcota bacterium]|nr:heme NO-binding domain-containing protein [Myxococcota bacterium]